jgi:hypothetical protein
MTTDKPNEQAVDLERARLDPGAVFAGPEALRDHPGLTREQKVELLRRWEYDARELSTAEAEGMVGGEGAILDRIEAVLGEFTESPAVDDGGA